MSPGGFLFVRYLIMPVAAALLLCFRFGLRWPRLSRADAFALLRLGLVGHLLHVGLVTYGIHWSTAFSSSLILACGPVFTLLILHWHGHEALTRGSVAGVAVACVGVVVFLSDKLFGGHWQASAGDLVLLVAASFFSYYTVAAKPLIERLGGVTVMTYAVLFGSLPVVALSLPAGLAVSLGRGVARGLGRHLLCGHHLGLPRLAGLGLGQRGARRRPDRAADVPDAAGRRPRRLGGSPASATRRPRSPARRSRSPASRWRSSPRRRATRCARRRRRSTDWAMMAASWETR